MYPELPTTTVTIRSRPTVVNSHDWWQSRNDVNTGVTVSLFFDKDHWKLEANSGASTAYHAPVVETADRRPFHAAWTEIGQEIGTVSGITENVAVIVTCTDTAVPTASPSQIPTEEPTEQPTFGPTQICGQINITGTKSFDGFYKKQEGQINGNDFWKARNDVGGTGMAQEDYIVLLHWNQRR